MNREGAMTRRQTRRRNKRQKKKGRQGFDKLSPGNVYPTASGCSRRRYFAPFTSTNSSTLARSRMAWGVAVTVAASPLFNETWILLGRLVQICPPRRLGSSLKFRLRRARGLVRD